MLKEIQITMTAADEAVEETSAEVLIYDYIGEDGLGGGVSAKGFAERLDALGPLNTITVRINSPGGSAWDGAAIYNALVRHPAKVNVEIDGIAASAASFIAMAGDKIRMAENATLMIHQASALVIGPANDMEKMATVLRKLDGQIASVYAKRTNRRPETWLKAMEEESWYTAEEAVEERLADEITPNKKRPTQMFNGEVLNRISKRPDKIAALLKSQEPDVTIEKQDSVFTPQFVVNEAPRDIEPPLAMLLDRCLEPDTATKLAEYAARVKEVSYQ